MRFGLPLIAVIAVFSIVLLIGKGSFLFIGMKPVMKKQYNIKRFSRIYGAGFGLIAIILAVVIYADKPRELEWLLMPGLPIVALVMVIVATKFGKKII